MTKKELILCGCGCGTYRERFDKYGRKMEFINGHHSRKSIKIQKEVCK